MPQNQFDQPERGLLSLNPDKFAQAAGDQEAAWHQEEWPRLHGDGNPQPYLFADQANAQLEDMRREYAYLLSKYQDLLNKAETMEAALARALDVLALKEKDCEEIV